MPLEVREPAAIEGAFERAVQERVDALTLVDNLVLASNVARVGALALTHRLPMMSADRRFVAVGGLIAYGANRPAQERRAATYVDKILKGANPAELPVERPEKFDLVINLKTAQMLGIYDSSVGPCRGNGTNPVTLFHVLQRRDFLRGGLSVSGLALLAGCGLLPPQAPTSEPVRLIGVLGDSPSARWDAFWDEMRSWAGSRGATSPWSPAGPRGLSTVRALANELVRGTSSWLRTASKASAAAKQATSHPPPRGDPRLRRAIEIGLVDNIARPAGISPGWPA